MLLGNINIYVDVNINDLVNTIFEVTGKAINIIYTPTGVYIYIS